GPPFQISGTAGGGWTIQEPLFVFSGGINITTGSAGDTVNVLSSLHLGEPITVNTGGGADTINVGSPGNSLDPIGNVTVNGGGQAGDTLNLFDQGDGNANTYTVTATTVNRTAAGPITYSGLAALNLTTTGFADTINVQGTA